VEEKTKQLKLAVAEQATTLVNAIDAVMKGDKKIVPEILVLGGNMGTLDGLAATLTKMFKDKMLARAEQGGDPRL
jgi:hypothetical protein